MSKESPVHNGKRMKCVLSHENNSTKTGGMVEIKGEKMNSGSPRSNPRAGGPVIFNDRIAAIGNIYFNSK